MTLEIKKATEGTVIEVVGRLDTVTAPALEKAIAENVGEADRLTLDIQGVEYISSAGLRVLLGAQKKLQKAGSLKLVHVCESVMEVFEITGFADILTIE